MTIRIILLIAALPLACLMPTQEARPLIAQAPGKQFGERGATLARLEADLQRMLSEVKEIRAEPPSNPNRPLLPSDAWPLTLGRAQAKRIVDDAVAGQGPAIVIPGDQLVYYGGGMTARPIELINTTLTLNWTMIKKELDDAETAVRRVRTLQRLSRRVANQAATLTSD